MFELLGAVSISEVAGTRNGGYFTSNRQIQFDCVYDSSFVFVSFEHNDIPVSAGGRFYIQDSRTHHSLVVSHTERTDAGIWSCTVEKLANRERVSVSTAVKYEGQCYTGQILYVFYIKRHS